MDPISQLPTEYQALYAQLDQYLKRLQAQGQTINPNIQIDPAKIAEFTAQAQREIEPYYANQLKVARGDFLRGVGYTQDQITQSEKQLEQQYGQKVRAIGEQAAEVGLARSGRRLKEEQELAQSTQEGINQQRQLAQYQAGTQAGNLAEQFGTSSFGSAPALSAAPRVIAGQSTFGQGTEPSPFYTLSPEIYGGLTGTQEFAQRGSVQSRASQLEEAFRQQASIYQQRNLTL